MSPLLQRSEALHARVQAFMRGEGEAFDTLACDIARFQAEAGSGLERLLAARGLQPQELRSATDIPAVPSDAFKLRRIACHPPALDTVVFRTSGTTLGARGEHPVRRTDSYEAAAIAWAREMLVPDGRPMHLVLLAPEPAEAPESSLGFMLQLFTRAFGAAHRWVIETPRSADCTGPRHAVGMPLPASRLCLPALRDAIEGAFRANQPVLVAGAAFAFVHLVDQLGGETLPLPAGSRAMQTGGTKGKSREVAGDALRGAIGRAFGLPDAMIASEYGMTELSSQAYDGTVRSALGLQKRCGPAGLYFAPPWMRVEAVDPITLAPTIQGETGIARILDLANVDSAVAIQTADQIRCADGGFELLGRMPGATPRGCSIGIDELLGAR